MTNETTINNLVPDYILYLIVSTSGIGQNIIGISEKKKTFASQIKQNLAFCREDAFLKENTH